MESDSKNKYEVEIHLYFDNCDEYEVYDKFGFSSEKEAYEWLDSLGDKFYDIYGAEDTLYSDVVLMGHDDSGELYEVCLTTIFEREDGEIPHHVHMVSGIDYHPALGLSDFANQVDECLTKVKEPEYVKRLNQLCVTVKKDYLAKLANTVIPVEKTQRFYDRYEAIAEKVMKKISGSCENSEAFEILLRLCICIA